MEERLIDIENRLSFQKDTIETLSNLLTNQQAQIDALVGRLDNITTLLQELMSGESTDDF